MSWLQEALRRRTNAFREYQGLPPILSPEEEEAKYNDEHLENMRGMFSEIANSPTPASPAVLPMLTGDVEDAAAGMAELNGEDFSQMTEPERQPYRESAMGVLSRQSKDAELARQAAVEQEGVPDGAGSH